MEGTTRRPAVTRPADLSAVCISQPSENSKAMHAVGRIAFSAVVVGGCAGLPAVRIAGTTCADQR